MKTKPITALRVWRLKLGNRASERPVTPELAMVIATAQAHFGWYLPTEVVLHHPDNVGGIVLDRCMYYSVYPEDVRKVTGMTLEEWPDKVVTERTYDAPDGPSHYTHSSPRKAYLVQVWEDRGDDGHTQYDLRGYALLRVEDFERLLKAEVAYTRAKTWAERYALEAEIPEIESPLTYCSACDTDSQTSSWVPGSTGGYPRCPNCGMC